MQARLAGEPLKGMYAIVVARHGLFWNKTGSKRLTSPQSAPFLMCTLEYLERSRTTLGPNLVPHQNGFIRAFAP